MKLVVVSCLIAVYMVIISCGNYSRKSDSLVERRFENRLQIEKSILQKDYQQARELSVSALKEYPDDMNFVSLLAISLFKSEEYENTAKLLENVFEENRGMYDSLNVNKMYFDLYYSYTYSLIELGRFKAAGENLYNRVDRTSLLGNQKVKAAFLDIRCAYRSGNFEDLSEQINNILKKYKLNNKLSLNLNFILADVYSKNGEYSLCIEILDRMIELDKSRIFLGEIKGLLDEIVYSADSDFLTDYNEQLLFVYQNLHNAALDKSFKRKILRDIYQLSNNSLLVLSKPQKDKKKKSILSSIRMLTDKNATKVIFGSNDSIHFDYHYDGDFLKIIIEDKGINSIQNKIIPLEGSGVKSFCWKSEKGNLIIDLGFSDSYDMSFHEYIEDFEKHKNIDNYQLVLNINLPDEEEFSYGNPVSAKDDRYTIVLDPGHGGDDAGALAVKRDRNGKRYDEKGVNLMLCKKLKSYLEERGYRVFLTRDKDFYPSLMQRNRIAQNRNADMFLSIHLNAAARRNKKYWQTNRYYGCELIERKSLGSPPKFINSRSVSRKEWQKRRKVALREHKELSQIFNKTIPQNYHTPFNKKRTIKYRNLGIFSGMTIPHALIEAGFIINNKNLEYLLSKKGQNALFKGIYEGIVEYRKHN